METITSNITFYRDLKKWLEVKTYHNKNGTFNYVNFLQEFLRLEHKIQLSRTSSHHQNGVVHKSINIAAKKARKMMLCAALRCTEGIINPEL